MAGGTRKGGSRLGRESLTQGSGRALLKCHPGVDGEFPAGRRTRVPHSQRLEAAPGRSRLAEARRLLLETKGLSPSAWGFAAYSKG